tara:strand:+ start:80 stop:325 length:246 start_codon:yes stop_codon:yes gene_type:complete
MPQCKLLPHESDINPEQWGYVWKIPYNDEAKVFIKMLRSWQKTIGFKVQTYGYGPREHFTNGIPLSRSTHVKIYVNPEEKG